MVKPKIGPGEFIHKNEAGYAICPEGHKINIQKHVSGIRTGNRFGKRYTDDLTIYCCTECKYEGAKTE